MSDLTESSSDIFEQPIFLEPRYVERIWGGNRFPAGATPVGEAWLVHESNQVAEGPAKGRTLAELVCAGGSSLLGHSVWESGERSFPLLVKLLDTNEWLSIQVHPDDRLAAELEGPRMRGKTEAWFAIEAGASAEVIAGIRNGVTQETLADAIRSGTIDAIAERHPLRKDEVLAMPAGTVHALGPGLFIYEIQQSSDITYRVSDWNRPAKAGRELHIEKSVRAADVSFHPHPVPIPALGDGQATEIAALEPFVLQIAAIGQRPAEITTGGDRFAIVTLIDGNATVEYDGIQRSLEPYDTFVVPAAMHTCIMRATERARALIAWPA
ncbi:MAG: class I mannose-6-phosphate isomerase [Thermomicrobiales bacterium]|nr:class I mannose-6-phosphate isomerase [Thermomicrobiales bacterium]